MIYDNNKKIGGARMLLRIVEVDTYVPLENDLCLMHSTAIENSFYYVLRYIGGSWKWQSFLFSENITAFLRMHQKVSQFGHYDEGYYRTSGQ